MVSYHSPPNKVLEPALASIGARAVAMPPTPLTFTFEPVVVGWHRNCADTWKVGAIIK